MAASSTELAWGSDLAHIASKLSAAPDVHSLLLTAAFQIGRVQCGGCGVRGGPGRERVRSGGNRRRTEGRDLAGAIRVRFSRSEASGRNHTYIGTRRSGARAPALMIARSVLLVPVRRQKDLLDSSASARTPSPAL